MLGRCLLTAVVLAAAVYPFVAQDQKSQPSMVATERRVTLTPVVAITPADQQFESAAPEPGYIIPASTKVGDVVKRAAKRAVAPRESKKCCPDCNCKGDCKCEYPGQCLVEDKGRNVSVYVTQCYGNRCDSRQYHPPTGRTTGYVKLERRANAWTNFSYVPNPTPAQQSTATQGGCANGSCYQGSGYQQFRPLGRFRR